MYLYKLYDATDQLLYVGITSYPKQRLKDHRQRQQWWHEVARHDMCEIPADEAFAIERDAIHRLAPQYNKANNPHRLQAARKPKAVSPVVKSKAVSPEVKQLADRITAELTRTGISQAELSRRLDIDASVVSRYVAGQVDILYTTLTRIAGVLGITTAQLVGDGQLDGELAS